jgi:hypothetical protein
VEMESQCDTFIRGQYRRHSGGLREGDE